MVENKLHFPNYQTCHFRYAIEEKTLDYLNISMQRNWNRRHLNCRNSKLLSTTPCIFLQLRLLPLLLTAFLLCFSCWVMFFVQLHRIWLHRDCMFRFCCCSFWLKTETNNYQSQLIYNFDWFIIQCILNIYDVQHHQK